MKSSPTDHRAQHFPVSIKGVLCLNRRIPLLRNERDEWELPGGKLEAGEDPMLCLQREIAEELGIEARPSVILDSWLYRVASPIDVLIVTYGCLADQDQIPVLSHEHKELRLFDPTDIGALPMPEGYKRSISSWLTHARLA